MDSGSGHDSPAVGFDGGSATPFLSRGARRSGEISPFAEKLLGESFVWLASMVVFGSTMNVVVSNGGECNHLCSYAIGTSIISAIVTTFLLFAHWVTWTSTSSSSSTGMDRGSWFNSNTEKNFMGFLMVWWGLGVGGLSAPVRCMAKIVNKAVVVRHASDVGICFGWLALFGSIYTTFKAYHTSKEEEGTLALKREPYMMALSAGEYEDHYANF